MSTHEKEENTLSTYYIILLNYEGAFSSDTSNLIQKDQ